MRIRPRHPRSTSIAIAAALVASAAVSSSSQAITQTVTGSFRAEVDRWKGLAFGDASNLYVQPTAAQQAAFRQCFSDLWTGNYTAAGTNTVDTQAAAFGYEYIRFNDTDTGQVYYGLREVLTNGAQTKGWGITFANFSAGSNTMVEVPHVRFDTNTEDLGARTFQNSAARGFTMAGAHRNANGFGTADVARLVGGSTFQVAHEVMNGPAAQTVGWQIHGFDLSGIPTFPADTAVVMTNGNGTVTAQQRDLNARYDANGWLAYGYNTLATNNALNVEINTGSDGTVYPGTTFDDLGAVGNHQGAYSRSLGGVFMHVEHEQLIRFSTANRTLAAGILADSMRATGPVAAVVKKWDAGAGATSGSWTTGSGSNWSTDGLPQANNAVTFDNSLVATLPANMTLTAQSVSVRSITWDSNQSSTLASATTGSTDSVIALYGDGPTSSTPLLRMGASATNSTFTIAPGSTSTGSGEVEVWLNATGAFEVTQPGATLAVGAIVRELGPSRRLIKTGNGTLVLSNASNAFTGGVTPRAGVMSIASIGAMGTSPAAPVADFVRFEGGTLRYTGASATMANNRGITLVSSGSLDVSNASTALTFNGVVTGAGTLNLVGPGTVLLGGANTFGGTLLVSAGKLVANSATALGTTGGPTLVLSGATLELRGTGTDYAAEPLMIAGSGSAGSAGAVVFSGASAIRFPGSISLSIAATIANTATSAVILPGGVSGAQALTFAGVSPVSVGRVRVANLNVVAPRVTFAPEAASGLGSTSVVTDLTIANGSTLDISGASLVVNYEGASPAASLRARLSSAFAGGAWTGTGLTSSVAQGTQRMVGYAHSSVMSSVNIEDVMLDSTSLLVRLTLGGDATLDSTVNFDDLLRLAAKYNQAGTWDEGDFNYDGVVTFDDLLILAANYNSSLPASAGWAAAQAVPEPGLMLASFATAGLLARVRRRVPCG
jgi:autotransporter-associated beta strand protein